MNKVYLLLLFPIILFSDITGKIVIEAKSSCFGSNVDGSCEVSGVDITEDKLLFINDKRVDGYSSLFSTDRAFINHKYIYSKEIDKSRKFEDMTIYRDQLILITSFDRDKKSYNRIVGYDFKREKSYLIADKSIKKRLRDLIGHDYFKIEGIEAINSQIFIGIREVGKNYKNFDYTIKILSIGFGEDENGEILLNGEMRLYKEFQVANLGLSSLKYDYHRDTLYILTSLELKGKMEGYIFYIEHDQVKMLNDKFHIPIRLRSKAEGITMIDENHLLIVYDDDRETKNREKNEFKYSVIRLH